MKEKRKTYSRNYKLKLMELCKSSGNVSAVSREYSVTINNLNRWIQEFNRMRAVVFPEEVSRK
ncbi:MAG: transposase [Flavobacteriales bacterium]